MTRYSDSLKLYWKTIIKRGGVKQALLKWGEKNKNKITPSVSLKRHSLFYDKDYMLFDIRTTPIEMFDIIMGVDENNNVKIYNYDWYETIYDKNATLLKDIFELYLTLYELIAYGHTIPDIYENPSRFIKDMSTYNNPIKKFLKSTKLPYIEYFVNYKYHYNGKFGLKYTLDDYHNMKKDLDLLIDIVKNYTDHPLIKLALLESM